jgi:hypothetical protein
LFPPEGDDPALWEAAWRTATRGTPPAADVYLTRDGSTLVVEVRGAVTRAARVDLPRDDDDRLEVVFLALGLASPSGSGLSWADLLPPPPADARRPWTDLPATLTVMDPPPPPPPPRADERPTIAPPDWQVRAPTSAELAAWWPESELAAMSDPRATPWIELGGGIAARGGTSAGAVGRGGFGASYRAWSAGVLGAVRSPVDLVALGGTRWLTSADGWVALEVQPVGSLALSGGFGASFRSFQEDDFIARFVTPVAVLEARAGLRVLPAGSVWVRGAYDTRPTELVVGDTRASLGAPSLDAGFAMRLDREALK